ncbi:MAG: hypothetical protein ACK44E_08685 [Anaerolineales bacterium]
MVSCKKADLLKKLPSIALFSSLLLLGAFSYSPSSREALASPSLESIIASLVPADPPGVPNPDALIGDREILQALDFWIRGRPVPGMGQAISDMQILQLLDLWIKRKNINSDEPVGTSVAVTDSNGKATLITSSGNIFLEAKDQNGMPFVGVEIHSYELEDHVLVIAGHEEAFPAIRLVSRHSFSPTIAGRDQPKLAPQLAFITLLVVLVKVTATGYTIWNYINNPDEFPFQIPGVIEGSRKVKRACLQIDANDLLSIGSLISAGKWAFKALQVTGAPARLRGVTAINLGFTRKTLLKETAKAIGAKLIKFLELMDEDIINTCEYVYEDRNQKTKTIPVLRWTVEKRSSRPEIISIDLPSEIPADDTPISGRVNFRDRDGDISWIEFRDTANGSITGAWDPGVLGSTSGSIAFDQRCNIPKTFTYRVILRDQAGNKSDPAYFTIRCFNPSSPPEILSIDFPAEIPNDGSRINGTVRFRDPDGDINWVRFETLSGRFTPFSFDPSVSGQTSGSLGFLIWCNETQTVTVRVILQDRAGNESVPFDFTFRCVPPVGPPVITRIDFPREIFANSQPVEGRVYFTSPGSNVSRAKFEVLSGTWNPLDFNPAQSLVSGTLQQGVFTFTARCHSPEVGRFRVTLYNEAGLASRSEEFSFVCRPIYRDEICGNGIDDDGDGYIDAGCSTISILLEDTGAEKDDVFRLFIDGIEIPPDTPVGGRRFYSIDGLFRGRHTVEVFVVRDRVSPGTFTLTLSGGAVFESGGTQYNCEKSSRGCPGQGESQTFTIIVP